MCNHENMVGQHYQVTGRDQTIHQLRTELAVAQNQLQSLSQSEAVAKQLAGEMSVARAQVASMESSVQKTINDMKAELGQRGLHLQKKTESDVQAQGHTISIQRNRTATHC